MKVTGYTIVCVTCRDREFYGISWPAEPDTCGAAKAIRNRCARNGLFGCRLSVDRAPMTLTALDQVRLGLAPEPPAIAPVPERMTAEERAHYGAAPARRAAP